MQAYIIPKILYSSVSQLQAYFFGYVNEIATYNRYKGTGNSWRLVLYSEIETTQDT